MLGGQLMFGHQDEQQQTVSDQVATAPSTSTSWSTAAAASTTDSTVDSTPTDPVVNDPVTSAPADTATPVAATDDLLNIKQQALSQLSPIVSHLDQSPEDRFRTLMMMIQASDNQSLIKTAYDAAQQITDEKQKAQALLDIVNEINYFTHQGQDS